MLQTVRRALLSWTVACLAVACGDATSPDTDSFVGVYMLRTVDGSPLPAVISQSGTSALTYIANQLTIADGGTWSQTATLETRSGGQTSRQTFANGGFWTRSLNDIQLNFLEGPLAYSGNFSRNRLSLISSGAVLIFEK